MTKNLQSCKRLLLLVAILLVEYSTTAQMMDVSASARLHTSVGQRGKNQLLLLNVLSELEAKHQVSFHYNHALVNNLYVDRVSYRENSDLEEVLVTILSPLKLKFSKVDNKIYLIHEESERKNKSRKSKKASSEAPETAQLNSFTPSLQEEDFISLSVAQQFAVKGNVSSAEGEAIPGANVLLKGTTTGTVTDVDGNYSLTIPSGDGTLVISFIGFITEEVNINNQSTLNVSLTPDIQTLSEVVVVGYGTQKKRDVTGSVAQISSDKIKDVPAVSMDQFIQGRAAGVQVTQSNGQPGGSISIRIRGNSSIRGSNEPLYVIDGVPLDNDNNKFTSPGTNFGSQGNSLATLNPNDIASIEILKDASASAIYGSRGANGVVLITTRRGKAGQSSVTLDSYYGVSQIQNQYDMLNTEQFLSFVKDSYANAVAQNITITQPAVYSDPNNWVYPGTDWQDEVYRSAPMQNHSLGITGGNEKSQYAISGAYFNQQGTLLGTDLKRYSFRVNMDTRIIDRLKIGNSLSVTYTDDNQRPTETDFGLVTDALEMQPGIPVRANGTFGGHIGDGGNNLAVNPVGNAEEWMFNIRRFRTLGSIFGELEITKWLSFRSSLGIDYINANIQQFESSYNWGIQARPSRGSNDVKSSSNWITENYFTVNKKFDDHNLTAIIGTSAQYVKRDNIYASRSNYVLNDIHYLNQGAESNQVGFNGADHYSFLSYYGRVNYSYRDKYLLTATYRTDGSSKFGPENKWGVFPSFSAGWIVSDETFLQNIAVLDLLKLKAGYGQVGNSEIGLYTYRSNLARGSYILGANQGQVNSVHPDNIPNPAVAWETTEQYNVGLEIGILKSRIKVDMDYYVKNTLDMLLQRPYPGTSGNFNRPFENIGKLTNKGFELTVSSVNTTGTLQWNTDLNFSLNRSKFVSGGEKAEREIIDNHWISRIGHPIGMFYGHIADGIFQSQAEVDAHAFQADGTRAGDIRFKDVNNDGFIGDADRVIMGNAYPDFIYGITNTLLYKNFDFSLFLQGVQGNEVYNQTRSLIENLTGLSNQTTAFLDSWTEQNTNTSIPRAIQTDPNRNGRRSTRWLEDGSFMRVKNITLGYNLPKEIIEKWGLSKARFYITGQNLFTFTKYSGYDPEVGGYNQGLYIGGDFGTYPIARTVLGGVNLQF